MAWNTSFAKYKSNGPGTNGGLAGLDCGYNIRQTRTTQTQRYAIFTTPSTGMEVGTCVAMIRIFAGETIVGAQLSWAGTTSTGGLGNCFLGVGDPYACGRFLGPVYTQLSSGSPAQASDGGCGVFSGTCGTMIKFGPAGSGGRGDACGIGYTYTCETDIVVTNLYKSTNAAMGGWAGSTDAAAGSQSATATGVLALKIEVIPA